ncbi:MAG: phenylalanine--tRNA ligase subunit beta, partial [Pseudomonadota bacterium]
MKFTLSWLHDHLETDASVDELCTALNAIGLEVEGVADPADTLGNFVIARVLEAKPHPDADKLRVCTVDFGADKPIQVVCGAPNARTGLVGVFAPEGTYVPGTDLLLKKAKIRGVESSGMLCSERELELSDAHDGIIDLDADLEERVGERYIDVAGLNDPVIEIAITPNRPDALGVRGVARDLAAAGLGKLKKDPAAHAKKGAFPCPVDIAVTFDDDTRDACPVFVGRYVRGVKNGPSPDWLQARLRAIGLKPISALVDITNYISYDRARPLHVYDADKLAGTIHARLGRQGEEFVALDDKTYAVTPAMTVIADDNGVLGFGGIMGGATTGASDDTVNVLIESAYFDPVRTALTGRAAGINSDARYRFERGIDPQSCIDGADMAAAMVADLCGGEISHIKIAGTQPEGTIEIDFDPDLVEQLTGHDVKTSEIKKTLEALGFDVDKKGKKNGKRFEITSPSWRPDIG